MRIPARGRFSTCRAAAIKRAQPCRRGRQTVTRNDNGRYPSDHYPVFALFGDRPTVAWSGTWESEPAAIKEVVDPLRDRLQILGTEQSVRGVEALAGIVEGEMYYWASVNPSTMERYQAKLHSMADATRESGGLWIAPVAPGFDARQVGGTSEVPRLGGATLRTEWQAAINTNRGYCMASVSLRRMASARARSAPSTSST